MAVFGKIFVIVFVAAFVACTTAEVLSELTIRKERACERTSLSITCPSGRTIFVTHALYGRVLGPDEICPYSSSPNENCRAPTSLSVVQRECNGRFSCTVAASNGVFGDPCRGTFKYLDVTYSCA